MKNWFMLDKKGNILMIISIVIYIISLTQETFYTRLSYDFGGSGFNCLILGWIGVFVGGAYTCWLANPALILSWIFFKRKNNLSIILSGISTTLCFAFLSFHTILKDEAGNYDNIIGYRIGYWLWTFSSAIFFLGNVGLRFQKILKKPIANNG